MSRSTSQRDRSVWLCLKPYTERELDIAIQIALYKHKLDNEKNNLLRELKLAHDSMEAKSSGKNSSTDRCQRCTARSAQAERRRQESTGGENSR